MPALLLITVRFFVPLRHRAPMRFSGMPHRPKPPIMMVAPSWTSAIASLISSTTLFTSFFRHCALCALEHRLDFAHVPAFERIKNSAKTIGKEPQFQRERAGGLKDIPPHMEGA